MLSKCTATVVALLKLRSYMTSRDKYTLQDSDWAQSNKKQNFALQKFIFFVCLFTGSK